MSSIPRNGLVWEWLLNWTTVDTNDWTKNNGTATNVTYVSTEKGYQKQAWSFNGTNSWITSTFNIWSTTTFSIVLLFNATNIALLARLFARWQFWNDLTLQLFQSKIIAIIWQSTGSAFIWTQSATLLSNTNYFIVLTYNWASLNLYINWVLSTSDSTTKTIASWAVLTSFWYDVNENKEYFNWKLQSIRCYNRVLTTSEIQNLYLEWLRQLWAWADNILASAVAYYDFNWDANDVIGWNNWVNNLWTFNSSDIFWITRWVNFSANNRHIISQSTITYPSSTIFTYELFIKTSSITNWYLLCNQVANSSIEVPLIISSWKIVFANTTRAVTTNSSITWTIIVNDWTYKHIVWVRNWTNYSIYVNWVLDISATWAAQAMTMWPLTINWRNEINPDNAWVPWIDYLFVRTYSTAKTADEVKELYRLSSIKYLYPFRKQLPLNLRDWLVFWGSWDTSWTTYYDASWAWNNGTLVNSPTLSRTGQHKQYTFNGTTQYITLPNTNITSNLTVWAWIKTSTTWTTKMIILNYTQANDPTAKVAWWQFNITSWNFIQFTSWKFTWITFNTDYKPVTWVTNICDWKYHLVVWQWNWTSLLVYVDWRLEATTAWANAPVYTSNVRSNIWTNEYTPWTRIHYFNWIIENPMIWNKALTQTEIQQLYYSTFTS